MKSTIQAFYKASGKFSPTGLLLALGIGLQISLLLGFLYNVVMVLMPLIYFNFIFAVSFGVGAGYLAVIMERLGQIRNRRATLIMAVLFGLTAWLTQWYAYLVYLNTQNLGFTDLWNFLPTLINLSEWLAFVSEVYSQGSWSIFGTQVSGLFLGIIWLIELPALVAMPIWVALRQDTAPYSENFGKWYGKRVLHKDFGYISSRRVFLELFQENIIEAIDTLPNGTPYRYSKVSVYSIDREDNHYLTIENIWVSQQGERR